VSWAIVLMFSEFFYASKFFLYECRCDGVLSYAFVTRHKVGVTLPFRSQNENVRWFNLCGSAIVSSSIFVLTCKYTFRSTKLQTS
jgi:hypothetical protein